MNATVGGIISALGQTVQGYGVDKERRIKDALASRKQSQDEDRDRVLNVLSGANARHLNAESDALPSVSGANIRHLNAESNALEHPAAKPAEFEVVATDKGLVRVPKVGEPGIVKVPGVSGELNKPKTEPTAHYTFPVGEEGIMRGNTLTGELEATGHASKPSLRIESATNTAAKARLEAAVSEMNNAHKSMADFEGRLSNGEYKIGAGAQVLGRVANAFTHDDPISQLTQSGALAALNSTDPELARYIRRGLSFAEGESMVSQRPSDFRTKMAAFLSTAASGASPEMIADIQGRRNSILNPLNATVKGTHGAAPADHSQMSDEEFAKAWKSGQFKRP